MTGLLSACMSRYNSLGISELFRPSPELPPFQKVRVQGYFATDGFCPTPFLRLVGGAQIVSQSEAAMLPVPSTGTRFPP